MAKTEIGGDLITDGSINIQDLDDNVNRTAGKTPKIFTITGFHSNLTEIDYTILNLFPRRTFSQGELQKVEWFRDQELTDMVLQVDIEYTRDSAGFAIGRTTRRRWVNNDGSFNVVEKNTYKDYTINQGESIKEGKLRRGALVDNIQKPVLQGMFTILLPKGWSQDDILLSGRRFMDDYESDFNKFIRNSSTITMKSDPNYGRKQIVVRFEQENDSEFLEWLDDPNPVFSGATIREYLITEFSI